ncbi:MAG: 1-(5-phosphoribosyl)-5-[(5-phosphoribosylamino)methylideneamino]imidazole-4-carboxamide isomerase [Leptospiraceae bacterium]|nr:1-(5-phosphoribosyl)-5-[(5-phosphoribosylamino)methylideneamino]imidazole-4-carboxamide isomerase [Leptospiraceae bacterium]MCP5495201.1 1-(5-phosphoribosyl)-5-[(5-phosphoribosylamino)methylideneamino]imidazole-4-carboxamide isomerase [Leptospiraceae bacterium]
MKIIPAIDLLEKEAVRLYKGDYSQKKVYHKEPWKLAESFWNDGADFLHIVDLDAARNKKDVNKSVVQEIRNATKAKIELGGGIRDLDTLKFYESIGIDRFIIGSAAVTNPAFLDESLVYAGNEKIVVGVDARNGIVKIHGWEKDTNLHFTDLLKKLQTKGVKHIVFTDISRDGTMQGPNVESYRYILDNFNFDLVASGGVSSLQDISELVSLPTKKSLFGIITGKAIYENSFRLSEAIKFNKN